MYKGDHGDNGYTFRRKDRNAYEIVRNPKRPKDQESFGPRHDG